MIEARGGALTSGSKKSCGCSTYERFKGKEFISKTSEYKTWAGMLQRCTNPNANAYERYGGRGIKVCRRWDKFQNFLADMGKKPSPDLTLERKDNNKGYNPKNCCWATRYEQTRNRSSGTTFITFSGRTLTMSEWAREIGITPYAMANRLSRGWTLKRALTQPLSKPFGH